MSLWIASACVAGGMVLLIVGADLLVANARKLGLHFGLTPMIVGATIVAFGTSAPEFLVSMVAALQGAEGLATGNLLGSNVANIALVLGAAATLRPVPIDRGLVKREYASTLLASLLAAAVMLFALDHAPETHRVSRLEGGVLMVGFALFFVVYVRAARRSRADPELVRESAETAARLPLSVWLFGLLGLGMLVGGSQLVVMGGEFIATHFAVPEAVVGATILAIGTSLPELALTVVAALRGENEIAVGNVLGSNVFNLLFVLGPVAAIHPIAIAETERTLLLPLMVGVTLLLLPMLLLGRRLGRLQGLLLLACFGGYLALLVREALG